MVVESEKAGFRSVVEVVEYGLAGSLEGLWVEDLVADFGARRARGSKVGRGADRADPLTLRAILKSSSGISGMFEAGVCKCEAEDHSTRTMIQQEARVTSEER